MQLLDTHYHLDFIEGEADQLAFLEMLDAANVSVVAQTLLPSDYQPLKQAVADRCRLSTGFHPWYIESLERAQEELAIFADNLKSTRFIGEVGLDFYPGRLESASAELQMEVFRRLIDCLLDHHQDKPYVLSIHSVRSASQVLDILEARLDADSGLIPILHRFNGTSDELTRNIRLGGYLSVHPDLLKTKKGRVYVQQVPGDRLLLESDWPEERGKQDIQACAHNLQATLKDSFRQLSELRQEDMEPIIAANQQRLYS